MHYDHVRQGGNTRHGRDVAHEIKIQFLIPCRVYRVRRRPDEKRVSIGGCSYDGLGTDIAVRARTILDKKWLPEPFRQSLTYKADDNVSRTTSGNWNDDTHWPRRIGLRPRDPRQRRQRYSACGQMQKSSAA